MKRENKLPADWFLAGLCFALLFAACEKKQAAESNVPAEENSTVIHHAFGQTVIKGRPERIVTIGWGNQDVPLALGVVPVGMSEANYGVLDGSRILPWTVKRIEELGGAPVIFNDTAGLDFEAINDVQPDVILAASSGITRNEYDTLSKIAPVVPYPRLPWQTPWREQILLDAEGMGMKAEGQRLVADLDALIAEKAAAFPILKGKTAAFVYFDPADLSTISIYSPGDPRVMWLTDLGMVLPESVVKLAQGEQGFYLTISSENADLLADVDIMLTWVLGGTDLLGTLRADPLIGAIPAVRRGSIVMMKEGPLAASQTPSALSIPWAAGEYLALIAEAAERIK
jgi:iron complex transport system substrate-binding protein